ncbi:MAG: hypothetical protein K2Z80_28025 [Xanthobacteraceae bacterium]|nr:hypothetical protein [Xanthobacteraceae bacterium]
MKGVRESGGAPSGERRAMNAGTFRAVFFAALVWGLALVCSAGQARAELSVTNPNATYYFGDAVFNQVAVISIGFCPEYGCLFAGSGIDYVVGGTVSPSLPAGLSFHQGFIIGTASTLSPRTTYTITTFPTPYGDTYTTTFSLEVTKRVDNITRYVTSDYQDRYTQLGTSELLFPMSGTYALNSQLVIQATTVSGRQPTFRSSATQYCTVSGNVISMIGANSSSCIIYASLPENDRYFGVAEVLVGQFGILISGQTISFPKPADTPYAPGATVPLTASSTSGLYVTIVSSTPSVCTVSDRTLTLLGAGACVLEAQQAGNGNYGFATPVSHSISIARAGQTIAFSSSPPSPASVGGSYSIAANGGMSGNAVAFSIAAGSTANACAISGSQVSFAGVGTCFIAANQAGNTNYDAAPQSQQSIVVDRGSQTITFAKPADTVFASGAKVNLSATATSRLAVAFASQTTGVCTVAGSEATIVTPGTCTIKASQAGNTNYAAAADVAHSFEIGKVSQTITFAKPADTVFASGAKVNLSATATSQLVVAFASQTTGVCTVAGSEATIVTPGTCTIKASQAGNTNYAAAADVTHSFEIGKVAQTITFAKPAGIVFASGAKVNLSATATSQLALTFASQSTGVCTVTGSVVTIVAPGTCTIKASQAGTVAFAAAADVTQAFDIGKASQTITFTKPANIALKAGATVALSASASSGLAVTLASTTAAVCTVAGTTATIVTAGTCTIKASQGGNATIAAAPDVTVSFAIATAPALSASATVSPTTFSRPGERIAFQITLVNGGGVPATGIKLVETRLPDLACAATTLAAGGKLACQGTTLTTAADLSAGKISISPQLTYTYDGALP